MSPLSSITGLPSRFPAVITSLRTRSLMSAFNSRAGSPSRTLNGPLEGVFAVHKPMGITSAQVLRDIQSAFSPSAMFRPWIDAEKSKLDEAAASNHQRGRRNRQFQRRPQVKVGHGGTLDPLATGVLIVGIGSGTKTLGSFLECTKSYDTTLLFGAATDSYDSEGRVISRAPTDHLTRPDVEAKVDTFRGEISQVPPIYSALKVKGKALYEYARNGEEVPKVEARNVKVLDIDLVDYFEPGTHPYMLPPDRPPVQKESGDDDNGGRGGKGGKKKRKRANNPNLDLNGGDAKKAAAAAETGQTEAGLDQPIPIQAATADDASSQEAETTPADAGATPAAPEIPPDLLPAARVRMTVSSGFYVRSLCHDLAHDLGSAAHMVALVRTRQGQFSLDTPFPDTPAVTTTETTTTKTTEETTDFIPVLPYQDIAAGEDVWAPKVAYLLSRWAKAKQVKDSADPVGNGTAS